VTKLLHADITNKALRSYYNVYNAQGHDYPEIFFEKMMELEFAAMGVLCARQVVYTVTYRDFIVGKHIVDTELDDCVMLEYKVEPQLQLRHYAQLLSNLKIADKAVGLLLNFGSPKPEYKRFALTDITPKPRVWTPSPPEPSIPYPELRLALHKQLLQIHSALGPGFVYRIYVNATQVELKSMGIHARRFRKIEVSHCNQLIGVVTFDHFIVDQRLLLAPVCVSTINSSEINKVRTLLHHYGLSVGMIVNFQRETMEIKYVKG